jgi:putative transcriptional regulator
VSISRHPDSAWLIDFACGNLSRGFELVVSAHVMACPQCAAEVRSAERLGAALMLGATAASPRLRASDIIEAEARDLPWATSATGSRLPQRATSLQAFVDAYLDCGLSALPWRRAGQGLQVAKLRADEHERLWVLRAAPNTVLPQHGHAGSELTLVLKGAYFNGDTIYSAGDIEDANEDTEHQPIVTRDGECICLAATEGPLRFKAWAPRLAQRYLGI